jgi:hypothetical protein
MQEGTHDQNERYRSIASIIFVGMKYRYKKVIVVQLGWEYLQCNTKELDLYFVTNKQGMT